MDSSEDNTYNIKIVTNNNKKRKIADSDNSHETYIFLQNEELSNQNKQLIQEKKDLETEKNENEEFLDKSDRDKVYMRNFIKTLVEANNIQKSIIDNYNTIYSETLISIYLFKLLLFFNWFLIYIEAPSYALNILLFSYFFIFPILNKYTHIHIKNIERYKKEIIELRENNNFLDEYIDNM